MLTASHDIDYFIERQRSKLNKQPNRPQLNRQRPIPPSLPPPPSSYIPPSHNPEERLDFKVARILDEPPPRIQFQQPYYSPSPPPFTSNPYSASPLPPISQSQMPSYLDQEQRRYPANNANNNQSTFFDRFGEHESKRTQLKNDLKREYNEFLRSQRVPKSKSTSQLASPRGNTTRRVQFQQDGMVVAPWEKNNGRSVRTVQSMNDVSTPAPSMTTREYFTNRSQSRVAPSDEQYIRDREEYILELYDQIRELEGRKRQLEIGS